jgi:hypothetical protein
MERIDDILNDRIVAVGDRGKAEDFILATLSREEALRRYGLEDLRVEVVWFSGEG